MLGMSPLPGKRATLVIPKFTLDLENNFGRTLRQQGGLYAWNESNPRKTSVLVIPNGTVIRKQLTEPCDSKVDFMLGMSPTPGNEQRS
jgi:hypothetical protein